MSDAYHTTLIDDGGNTYERFAMAVVAAAAVAFVSASGTLFGWVSLSDDIGGIEGATFIALILLGLGTGVATLGVLSRWGGARTTPDRSPGLSVGTVQAGLWFLTSGLIASHTLELGTGGWLLAVPVGALVGYLTIGCREDVGATLPAAALIWLMGAVLVTGLITPTWTWEPAGFDATIPGTVVIPVLTILGSLLAGWSGATAHSGFGSRGRQNGAFLLISAVVMLVLSVLVFLLVFVFDRGVGVVLENASIGGGSALVLLGGAFVVLVRFGTVRPTRARGTDTIVSFVHGAIGIATVLAGITVVYSIVANQSLSGTSVTIDSTATVGAIPGLVVAAILLGVLRRSEQTWTPDSTLGRRINWSTSGAVKLLMGSVLLEVVLGVELAAGGVSIPLFLAGLVGLAMGGLLLTLVATRFEMGDAPSWIPPIHRIGSLSLWMFLGVCLHVVVTGESIVFGPTGIVAGGTIDWPFLLNPSQGLGIQRGVMPAVLGTIWIVLGAIVFAVPLGVGAAVYLTEYAEDSVFTRAVDIATNGLWSTPSIVFGLFGLAFLVPRFGGNPSIFAAQLVLGFMLLPLVLITSREAMKSVPDEYRDASAALGVSRWETIRSVVIPAAMPGVITGVILGVGRIAGETAPLLLVLNGPNFPNAAPGIISSFSVELAGQPPFVHVSNPALLERASALPYQLYAIITAGVGGEESFGWGTALVLLGVVLAFFAIGIASRRYFRHKLQE